jgi:NADPH:quinone reductase-like Zn-dependent oxidoreductase
MKASVYYKYGNSEVLEIREIEKPQPKADEILVKVRATTVNRTDCAMLKSKPYIMRLFTGIFKPNNPILGTDFAG